MTAQENLNPQQFMPTEKVGQMKSADWGGTVEEAYQRNVSAKAAGYGDWPIQQQELNADINANGIKTPIDIGRHGKDVVNGHHRYFAARELGIKEMPYRVDPDNGDR